MIYDVIPVQVNTPEWLNIRRQGIGGSDAAAVLGFSKWSSPYQVYLDKIGEADPIEESEPMYWGKALETAIVGKYSAGGVGISRPQAVLRSTKYPFMQYTPDGLVDGKQRLLEIKTSRYGDGFGEAGTDEIPQEYLLQVQHGMIVTGLPVADVAVLISGSEYRQYEIPADAELQAMIIEQEAAFWDKVQNKIEPEITTADDIKIRHRFSNGKAIDASDEIYQFQQRLKDVKAALKSQEEEKEAIELCIKLFMGDNEVLQYGGTTLATWKTSKPGKKFDEKSFELSYPDLYNQFTIAAKPQRRFLVK